MFFFIRCLILAVLFKLSLSTSVITIRGKVTGRVINSKATPLKNILVSLTSDSLVIRMTRTNANGEFIFDKLPKDNYRILIMATSYEKYTTGFFRLTDAKPSRDFEEIELKASFDTPAQIIRLLLLVTMFRM